MPLNRSDFGKPLSPEEVTVLEESIGRKIPAPYRAFLLQHGAGRPPGNIHPPVDSELPTLKDGFEIDSFLGPAERESLPASLKQLAEAGADAKLFPVIELVGGDLVCLDETDPEDRLVYWDHEESDPEAAKVELGETLEEFLAKLHA